MLPVIEVGSPLRFSCVRCRRPSALHDRHRVERPSLLLLSLWNSARGLINRQRVHCLVWGSSVEVESSVTEKSLDINKIDTSIIFNL